ncbi:MAG: DNA mismatch repair endonuclease MutL [Thermodesulfobacteriota bacterium]
MSDIKILPDILVSKISAGEVVERPSSVVKELIENSLDAGAGRVQINLESGGKKLISVVDDGSGMSKDDALMCLERHATSKIDSVDDLFSLSTLGFRGEALPSIASVSRFRLLTRSPEDDSGISITVDGGKIKHVEDAGSPKGTSIEVKNLFFNTPPRLKFLKRNETELIRIVEIIQREAIANPGVVFEAYHNNNHVLRFSSRENSFERIKEIIKNSELFEINYISSGVEVNGYMSSPFEGRSNTQKLYTYVNSRPVKDRFITRMVMDSYGKMLPKGKFPQGAIFINVPKGDVDVNVHPTKHEIKFRDQSLIGTIIKNSLEGMLTTAPWILGYKEKISDRQGHFRESDRGKYQSLGKKPYTGSGYNDELLNIKKNKEFSGFDENPMLNIQDSKNTELEEETLFKTEGYFSSMKIIGQVGALYIICETQNGIVLIDQHAAHERINYEIYKKNYLESGSLQKQELLIPEILELSPREVALFEKYQEELTELGFMAELFGKSSVRIKSVPAILNSVNISDVFTDLVSELDDLGESKSLNNKLDLICATMACHGSVRANQVLDEDKIYALLNSLDKAEFPHSCPHGRPVAKMITYPELEKMFGRI